MSVNIKSEDIVSIFKRGEHMRCEFELCIYQRDGSCNLDHIIINEWGMCDTCILVDVETDFLQEKKNEALLQLHSNPFTSDTYPLHSAVQEKRQ